MQPDDHVCLCFRVSLRKLATYLHREEPSVPSQLSDCLGAGTGCGWCVPQLERLHEQWAAGDPVDLPGNAGERVLERARWRQARRTDGAAPKSGEPASTDTKDAGRAASPATRP